MNYRIWKDMKITNIGRPNKESSIRIFLKIQTDVQGELRIPQCWFKKMSHLPLTSPILRITRPHIVHVWMRGGGDLGLFSQGPTSAPANKFYVRRKQLLGHSGQVPSNVKPAVDTLAPKEGLKSNSSDITTGQLGSHSLETQYALVKQMGLTHEDDSSRVRQMMLDMDNRDNKVAAEMGINLNSS